MRKWVSVGEEGLVGCRLVLVGVGIIEREGEGDRRNGELRWVSVGMFVSGSVKSLLLLALVIGCFLLFGTLGEIFLRAGLVVCWDMLLSCDDLDRVLMVRDMTT